MSLVMHVPYSTSSPAAAVINIALCGKVSLQARVQHLCVAESIWLIGFWGKKKLGQVGGLQCQVTGVVWHLTRTATSLAVRMLHARADATTQNAQYIPHCSSTISLVVAG